MRTQNEPTRTTNLPSRDDPRPLNEIPLRRWANGQGVTRLLAAGGAAGQGWRVSIAIVTDGAAFSDLPDTDRLFLPLLPGSITLHSGDGPLPAAADGSVRFAGSEAVTASVPAGAAYALNLIAATGTRELNITRDGDGIDVHIDERLPSADPHQEQP